MNPTVLIIAAVVIVGLIVAGMLLMQRRRSEHLRSRFGPEYERAVEEKGGRSKAEAELAEREKRVEKLDIRPLDPAARKGFLDRWTEAQARFVDDPPRAIAFADALIGEVMKARGYPVADFEQRAGDISVDHPHVVEHYRAGHDIALRHGDGKAGTEDLRQAMIHYRALFTELLEEPSQAEREIEAAH
jgi:hypothetical protein